MRSCANDMFLAIYLVHSSLLHDDSIMHAWRCWSGLATEGFPCLELFEILEPTLTGADLYLRRKLLLSSTSELVFT